MARVGSDSALAKAKELRELLQGPVIELSQRHRHLDLPVISQKLGLGPLPAEGSRRERVSASFSATEDEALPRVAVALLESFPPQPSVRNRIEDLLYENRQTVQISKRHRHELARSIPVEDLYINTEKFDELLTRLWVIDDDPVESFLGISSGVRKGIEQHVYRNPGDWETEYLFEQIGAFDAPDWRFVAFIEGLASSNLRPDVQAQKEFVQLVNEVLRRCGTELREIGSDGGYPVFKVIGIGRGALGRPKNLIFASQVKPDLRLRDAVSNDIEIVSNADKVLVYDRPIAADRGLCWQDLQDWWSEIKGVEGPDAKETLYRRLMESLPSNSPPQRLFFRRYHEHFKSRIPDLPALLPEVWLHWDPRTVEQRGVLALPSFRMDYLLLLPGDLRVVIEVDGQQHYSSPKRYGEMMASDRELRLHGYEVYRFGAAELDKNRGPLVVSTFFDSLYARVGVK